MPTDTQKACSMTKSMRNILGKLLEMEDEDLKQLLENYETYKWLVCIDMGCGNTSVYIHGISRDQGAAVVSDMVKFLEPVFIMQEGKDRFLAPTPRNELKTLINYVKGKPEIGLTALIKGPARDNFKELPDDISLNGIVWQQKIGNEIRQWSLRELWQDYFTTLRGRIVKWFPELGLSEDDVSKVLFVVAHPASNDWNQDPEVRKNYRSLIGAGEPKLPSGQIITISEAKAVMQYVQKKGKAMGKLLSLDFGTGVLIIDLGASTIDIAYLRRGVPILEYSLRMAGQEADAVLTHYLLKKWFPNAQGVNDDPLILFKKIREDTNYYTQEFAALDTSPSRFLFAVRMLKESISTKGCGSIQCGNLAQIDMTSKDLAKILGTTIFQSQKKKLKSWNGHFNEWLEACRGELLKEIGAAIGKTDVKMQDCIADIVVTGGTSNLVGVESMIRSAFNVVGDGHFHIFNDENDYNWAVPEGGAVYTAKTILQIPAMKAFPGKLQSVLKEDMNAFLKKLLTNKLWEVVLCPTIQTELTNWEQRDTDINKKQWANVLTLWQRAWGNDIPIMTKDLGLQLFIWTKGIDSNSYAPALLAAANGMKEEFKKQFSEGTGNGDFAETQRCISDFLAELAGVETYSFTLEMPDLDLRIGGAKIPQKISGNVSTFTLYNYRNVNRGQYSPSENRKFWRSQVRANLLADHKDRFLGAIRPAAEDAVANAVSDDFCKALVDNILEKMDNLIRDAMFF